MCTKVCFTKHEAQEALNAAHRFRRRQYRKEQRIYYCKEHNCWHLTSQDLKDEDLHIPLQHTETWQKLLNHE